MRGLGAVIGVLILLLVLASLSLFTVDQRRQAIVFRLGKVERVISQPGLYVKAPLVDTARMIDSRIQTIDFQDTDRFLTSEKINVIVDSFVKWQVADVRQYYVSVGGDAERAANRLMRTVNNDIRDEFGKRTVHDVVSGEREKIMEILRGKADEDGKKIGVRVLDVRIKRVELSPDVSDSVYRRMQAERLKVANERRSIGAAESERIRADADRQREVIIAEAYRDAQRIRGEGDAKAAAIYATAFSKNPEFYAFYRSLDTYLKSFQNKNNVLLLDPNSDFFKYLKNPNPATGK
jgi:modulator of FtsH protease HflC